MKTKVKPPKKLSKAILMALNDLALVEQDPRYKVDMSWWHFEDREIAKCHVCFAGSVMAKTCDTPINKEIGPSEFDREWMNTFRALNAIRSGYVEDAILSFYGFLDDSYYGFYESFADNQLKYSQNPTEFKNAMCDVAMMLESHGM